MNQTTINGLPLLVNIGTMRIIAEMTGKDVLNPLEGVTNVVDQCRHILYAGVRRSQGHNSQFTMEDAAQHLDDMQPADLKKIVDFYVKAVSVKADESQQPSEEEKKS